MKTFENKHSISEVQKSFDLYCKHKSINENLLLEEYKNDIDLSVTQMIPEVSSQMNALYFYRSICFN